MKRCLICKRLMWPWQYRVYGPDGERHEKCFILQQKQCKAEIEKYKHELRWKALAVIEGLCEEWELDAWSDWRRAQKEVASDFAEKVIPSTDKVQLIDKSYELMEKVCKIYRFAELELRRRRRLFEMLRIRRATTC